MTDLGNNNIATSKMTGVLPANTKRTNKGRFSRAKTFIRNKEGDRLTASWSAIEKQESEKKKTKQKTVYFHAQEHRLSFVFFWK